MIRRVLTIAAFISIGLSGCSSDESEMRDILKAVPPRPAVCLNVGTFPNRIAYNWPDTLKKMKALQKVGLVREDERRWFQLAPDSVTQYSGSWIGGAMCFGKRVFDKIDNFTPPAATAMGTTVSQVTMISVLSDLPKWASDPDMREVFPELLVAQNGLPVKDVIVLVKTSKGWSLPN
jgi:hypothetical protein